MTMREWGTMEWLSAITLGALLAIGLVAVFSGHSTLGCAQGPDGKEAAVATLKCVESWVNRYQTLVVGIVTVLLAWRTIQHIREQIASAEKGRALIQYDAAARRWAGLVAVTDAMNGKVWKIKEIQMFAERLPSYSSRGGFNNDKENIMDALRRDDEICRSIIKDINGGPGLIEPVTKFRNATMNLKAAIDNVGSDGRPLTPSLITEDLFKYMEAFSCLCDVLGRELELTKSLAADADQRMRA